jgi:hypothetical protein
MVIDVVAPRRPVEPGWLARQQSGAVMVALVVLGSIVIGAATALRPVFGVYALVAVALAITLLWRPAIGAFVLVAIVPAVSGLRRGLPLPGLRLSEALIVCVSALVLLPATRRQAVRWTAFDWLALAYVLVGAGLGVANIAGRDEIPIDAESIGTLVGPLQFLLLYRTVRTALTTIGERRLALRLVLVASVPVSLLGIGQQLDLAGMRALSATITASPAFNGWSYQNFPRATGPFPHWLSFAGYLLVVILIAVGLLLEGREEWVLHPAVLGAVLAAGVAALVLSLSLAASFGVLAGMLLLGRWSDRLKQVLLGICGTVVSAALLFWPILVSRFRFQFGNTATSGRNALLAESIAYRFQVWARDYLPAMSGRWVSGYGPTIPPEIFWKATESQYITLLLRGGLPLLTAYGALMLVLGMRGWHRVHHPEVVQRVPARVIVAIVIVLVPMQLAFPYFSNSGLPQVFWILPALLRDQPQAVDAPVRPGPG